MIPASVNRLRRRIEQRLDQAVALAAHRLRRPLHDVWDGQPRFALLSVNYNTTRTLKLMLLTLAEQERLDLLDRIVIADNQSRDGGTGFLDALAEACPRIRVLHRRWRLHHAPAMRAALRALDREDRDRPPERRANVLLHVDPDVVFLRPETLRHLANCFADPAVAFAGELRRHVFPRPEAQASFLAVRRDWAARRDISPWVHHGSPAWWLQRDCWERGGSGADFRSNRHGYALHRGRTAVAEAGRYRRWSTYATARQTRAHYMGVEGGRATWKAVEERLGEWLGADREQALVEKLAERFEASGD